MSAVKWRPFCLGLNVLTSHIKRMTRSLQIHYSTCENCEIRMATKNENFVLEVGIFFMKSNKHYCQNLNIFFRQLYWKCKLNYAFSFKFFFIFTQMWRTNPAMNVWWLRFLRTLEMKALMCFLTMLPSVKPNPLVCKIYIQMCSWNTTESMLSPQSCLPR